MMTYEDSRVARALLVELLNEIATGDTTRRERLLEVGGALFDANYLDGQQYALLHELYGHPTNRELLERCLVAV